MRYNKHVSPCMLTRCNELCAMLPDSTTQRKLNKRACTLGCTNTSNLALTDKCGSKEQHQKIQIFLTCGAERELKQGNAARSFHQRAPVNMRHRDTSNKTGAKSHFRTDHDNSPQDENQREISREQRRYKTR